jgi:2-hydroxychromene-2-carboxylate isomerase
MLTSDTDRACWEKNKNVADDAILVQVLTEGGFNGPELLKRANTPEIKAKLREATAEAKDAGICGVPSYRVFKEGSNGSWKNVGGIVWGQDETNVVEDLIAGWDDETSAEIAEPRKARFEAAKASARL